VTAVSFGEMLPGGPERRLAQADDPMLAGPLRPLADPAPRRAGDLALEVLTRWGSPGVRRALAALVSL